MEREKILYLEASKKKVQIMDKFLDGVFLGIKEGSEECIVCRTVRRRPADRVYIRNSVELADMGTILDALVVMQQRPRGLRLATRNSVGHESFEPCLQMSTSLHESGSA